MRLSFLIPLILFTACATAPKSQSPLDTTGREPSSVAQKPACSDCIVPSSEERAAEIAKARVFMPAGSEHLERSVFEGAGRAAFVPKWNEVIRCKFIEPTPGHPLGGGTPKFNCALSQNGNQISLRVKYQNPAILPTGRSTEENEGVWGDILGSRLLWRMGMYAREVYPVRVICENCPERPWEYVEAVTEPDADLTPAELADQLHPVRLPEQLFTTAEITYRSNTPLIETYRDQGWSWDEFAKLVPSSPEIRAEHDALGLLAAFLQHADNKAEQQDLRCVSANSGTGTKSCPAPILTIGDTGMTFGGGYKQLPKDVSKKELRRLRDIANDEATASLKSFSRAPIWSDPAQCITNIRYKESSGEPANQKISKPGRRLFLERIGRLSDQDIIDLFTTARIEERGEKMIDNGQPRAVTARDWLPAFKARLEKIRAVVCPESDN